MTKLPSKIWHDTTGFVVSMELILVAAIVIVGLAAGATAVRDSVICELSDLAGSAQDLNQSYAYNGINGSSAASAGSDFRDEQDFCDSAEGQSGSADNCITFNLDPFAESS